MSEQQPRKLIIKLTEVMQEVEYIQKTGYNRQQNYKYATEADVVEKVRKELAARKVFMKPDVKGRYFREITTSKGNTLTIVTLDIEYTFIDGETGERESFTIVAEGQDSMDKAVYKAMTGGLKYALMKSFMIPTGDDPENDSDEAPKQSGQQQPPPQQPQEQGGGGQGPQRMASEAQRKKVFAVAKNKGLTEGQLKALIRKYAGGKESTKDLTAREASDIISTIEPMSAQDITSMIGGSKA